ncbi:hypothetical protein EVJ58_g666 [Rhodofomes roseus]|uniref:RING-type domain-containing protein n=1 Tax=Rhodofomes roseus TaxID=34475 RepID=A0A4Y9Z6L7_9APHY|nr:hypothetical protein EVJ58_g666 [Rhodofomes roseus]
MDNQHSVGGLLQHLLDSNPQIGHAIHNFVRGFTNHHEPPREPNLPLDDPDLADMPPLEPIPDDPLSHGSSSESEEQPIEDVARSVGDLSLSSPPTPDSAIQNQDATVHSTASSAEGPSHRGRSPDAESVGSMPSLYTVSDADADFQMHDAEPSHVFPAHLHFSPQAGSRRARVDDEIDEEDLRETNRQRMSSPDGSDDADAQQARPATPGGSPQQNQDPPNMPPPPPYSRLVYSFDIFPGPGLDPPEHGSQGEAPAQEQNPHHHHRHPPLPMFNFTFHIPVTPGASAGAHAEPNGVPHMAGLPPQFFPLAPGAEPFFMPFFPFGPPREEEVDDPKRAEKLMRGLEEVPEGFVARIERVSGDEGDSLCSICWEKLSSEGGGFDAEEPAGNGADANARMDVDEHTTPASAAPTEAPSPTKKDLPRIVALPCSHVFHTSCLLPWFTKPHRTTCPSCRFDIDPESLTTGAVRSWRCASSSANVERPSGRFPRSDSGPATTAGPTPDLPFEFNLFFPVMGGPGGPGPAYIPLDAQTTRNLFQRLFGGAPQPPQQAPQEPQGQAPPSAPQSNAPAPNDQNPPAGGPSPWGIPNLWQNMFGVHPPHPPQATANVAAGAAPQRPASAASTGSRSQGRGRPPEKQQWTPPAPPGQTLRQRVERKERERGLRCWDVSCGLGPMDEDPFPVIDPSTIRQISINRIGGNGEKVCEHTFHPSCLVSAERVAGWGGEDKKEEKEGEEVEVSCPVCRAVGIIPRTDWDEGACALA